MISLSASEITNALESNPIAHQNIYRNLNELVAIFNFKAYYALSFKLTSSREYRDVNVFISKLGFNLAAATQQPCYVKTMAALYLSYATGSLNNKRVLEAVPPAKQLEVYQAIVEMAFACGGRAEGEIPDPQGAVDNLTGLIVGLNNQVFKTFSVASDSELVKEGCSKAVVNLIRLRLNEYIVPKETLHEGSALVRFLGLQPKQQAERNVASAYQILALLEQLEIYNATDASAADKGRAYDAVMNVVTDLVKQAEIRGYRLAEGQSSQFAKLLGFDIPHAPAATRDGNKTIAFPRGFDLEKFNAIDEKHRSENKWYKRLFKRSNNWIRQNSFTTAAFVLSGFLITLAAAALTLALLSPALPIALPLLGAIAASNLVIPAVIAALAGLSVSLVSLAFNNQNTANAKIGYADLGKLNLVESAPVLAPPPVPDHAAPLAAPAPSEGAQTPTSLHSAKGPAARRPRSSSEGSPAGFRSSRHDTPPFSIQSGDAAAADSVVDHPDRVAAPTVPLIGGPDRVAAPLIGGPGRRSSH
jgi:hypothetical protein